MEKRRAFTLVELLVVIAIIGLLMSILMPSLSRARRQAKLVVCQSNLRQWGAVFSMYTNDNNGYFWPGYMNPQLPENMWMEATRGYYKNPELRVCPETKKPLRNEDLRTNGLLGDPHLMWGIWPSSTAWFTKGDYGSYGANSWLNHPPLEIIAVADLWRTKYNWRNTSAKGANNIPVFLDSWWVSGFPHHNGNGAEPPAFSGDVGPAGAQHEMTRFCIDRHGGGIINTLFLDFSVRKVGLKELWTLKWHRRFDINGEWTIAYYGGNASACASKWDNAAAWMEKFPEF